MTQSLKLAYMTSSRKTVCVVFIIIWLCNRVPHEVNSHGSWLKVMVLNYWKLDSKTLLQSSYSVKVDF